MKEHTAIDLRQVESSKPGYKNLYEQLEFGRFNSVKSGAAPTLYHEIIAEEGQTTFVLPKGSFTIGDHSLQVFVNGQMMRVGLENDYTEIDNRTIEFTFGVSFEDVVVMRVNGGTSGPLLHENARATEGQTKFSLIGSYEIGNNSLIVFVNGAYQTLDVDYVETDAKNVTFTEPLEDRDLVTFRVEGLPSIQQKYSNSTTSRQYNANNELIREETIGESKHIIKEYEYDVDGRPLRLVIRDAGFIITRTYTWDEFICISINEEVKEGT